MTRYYKNLSVTTKTFHGVKFNPGEVKPMNEYINHPCMIVVDEPKEEKVEAKLDEHVDEKPKLKKNQKSNKEENK